MAGHIGEQKHLEAFPLPAQLCAGRCQLKCNVPERRQVIPALCFLQLPAVLLQQTTTNEHTCNPESRLVNFHLRNGIKHVMRACLLRGQVFPY